MELIGKKITRTSSFEKSTNATVTVGKGKLKFSGAAMRKIGLFKKEIGIGYDASGTYLYTTEEGSGNKVHDNGACNSSYHSKALLDTFKVEEETAEFNLSTEVKTFDEYEGISFYEITTQDTVTPVEAEITENSDEEYATVEEVGIEEETVTHNESNFDM